MIYTVTLNPAIDYVVQLSEPLCPGGLNRSHREAYQIGGKGINVSWVLQALGVPTLALGFIAGFTGQALEQELARQGLPARFLKLEAGMTRINVKVKAGEETEINGAGPVITPEAMEWLYTQLEALEPEDMLVLSGSVPGCLDAHTYARLLQRLSGKGIAVTVDATGPLLRNTLPLRPFLVKPNQQELGQLFGRFPDTDALLREQAGQLQALGARNVLVSLAGDGALLLDETGRFHRIGCPAGKVRNSVGAGDSMVAGFLAGYLQTGDYAHALKLGTAAGSATAFCLGLADGEQIRAAFSAL